MKNKLADFYLAYLNDFLSQAKYAEFNGMTIDTTNLLLTLGRQFHDERTEMLAFKTLDQVLSETKETKSVMAYCDYIASLVKDLLPGASGLSIKTGRVKSDLHEEMGYIISTSKTISAEYLGKKYKITIEEDK